jgi:hypothetical protein
MTEEEMSLFSAAQLAAGYLTPERNPRSDGWLYERDHDRFVGWQFGRMQERERCAALCEGLRDVAEHSGAGLKMAGAVSMATSCAKLIRA